MNEQMQLAKRPGAQHIKGAKKMIRTHALILTVTIVATTTSSVSAADKLSLGRPPTASESCTLDPEEARALTAVLNSARVHNLEAFAAVMEMNPQACEAVLSNFSAGANLMRAGGGKGKIIELCGDLWRVISGCGRRGAKTGKDVLPEIDLPRGGGGPSNPGSGGPARPGGSDPRPPREPGSPDYPGPNEPEVDPDVSVTDTVWFDPKTGRWVDVDNPDNPFLPPERPPQPVSCLRHDPSPPYEADPLSECILDVRAELLKILD